MYALKSHLFNTALTLSSLAGVSMALAAAPSIAHSTEHKMKATSSDIKPTIILVHGAFAESSSWDGVTKILIALGYPVIAVANPLRSLKTDADYVASVVKDVQGSVVLVGHSYGGSVITNAANQSGNVKALVYVSAFAPDTGETAAELSGKFPGGTLGSALAPPVALPDGGVDLYIQQDKFRAQFAADVAAIPAKLMAITQRPVANLALNEPSGAPAWKTIPSWFIFGTLDKNIPLATLAFMAQRAHAKKTFQVRGASHVVMVSHPDAVAKIVAQAATAT